jgi:hypothetical protein
MGQIQVGFVHPFRRTEIQEVRVEHLPKPWNPEDPLGDGLHERVVVGHRAVNDRNPADRKADVSIGILSLEESRVQR